MTHPVLVIPGAQTSDSATSLMRATLSTFGFAAHGWGQGINMGFAPGAQHQARLGRRLLELHERTGAKVSLLGFSLGGVFARSLARKHPHATRLVVSVASPFRRFEPDALSPLPVPSTCMFSKDDTIAHWEDCIEPADDDRENIEFRGSHMSITAHPAVAAAVLDRLAQPSASWRPFEASLANWMLFPAAANSTRR